jgi:hypothetical protein
MSTGADHDISNALAVIADEVYGVDLYALPDRCQAAVKQQIATSHGQLLAALVIADAQFQTSVELGRIADALAQHRVAVVPK